MRTSSAKPNFLPFLSTPSARRATGSGIAGSTDRRISIHALREEGDAETRTLPRLFRISIHALREEGDTSRPDTAAGRWKFLSTPSARRATGDLFVDHHQITISIHALREEGDLIQHGKDLAQLVISIHALREEGDLMRIYILSSSSVFLSTPSARRATYDYGNNTAQIVISIHALREEGDQTA